MKRDNKLTVYVSDDTKTTLERRAQQEGMDVSPYIDTVLRRYFTLEAEEEIADEVRAAERIEELVALGKDELRELTREIADMNAKMGAYAAANFELMKQDHPDAMRRDALATGSERIRKDVTVVQDELTDDTDAPTDTADTRSEPAAVDADGDDDRSIFDELRGND
jgi:thioesterase domain-containing protein